MCHFLNSPCFPGGWLLRPLCGLFWRRPIPLNKVRLHPYLLLHIPVWRGAHLEELLLTKVALKKVCLCWNTFPCCWGSLPLCCLSGQGSGTQQAVPDRRGRRSNFPKRGTATTVVEFLGQQVWKPIWSAGIFTRLENKPE